MRARRSLDHALDEAADKEEDDREADPVRGAHRAARGSAAASFGHVGSPIAVVAQTGGVRSQVWAVDISGQKIDSADGRQAAQRASSSRLSFLGLLWEALAMRWRIENAITKFAIGHPARNRTSSSYPLDGG